MEHAFLPGPGTALGPPSALLPGFQTLEVGLNLTALVHQLVQIGMGFSHAPVALLPFLDVDDQILPLKLLQRFVLDVGIEAGCGPCGINVA